jgi:hypothetical protein
MFIPTDYRTVPTAGVGLEALPVGTSLEIVILFKVEGQLVKTVPWTPKVSLSWVTPESQSGRYLCSLLVWSPGSLPVWQ